MPPTPALSLRDQLLREATEMIRFAFASGKSIPTSVVDAVEQYESHPADQPPLAPATLVLAHSRLVRIVSPATPRAIMLLADGDTGGAFGFLGPVVLVRQLMVVAISCVVAFVVLGLFESTGSRSVTFVNTWGWSLLLNEMWWLSAAGVGASFAILFQVNEYIRKSSYNPKYAPTYWVKFLLGVMAGYILVALLPLDLPPQGAANLMQPALALLGGYSASAVYRILTRLVEAVEAIFRGNMKEMVAERERAASARVAEEASNARMRLAARLVDVQSQLAAGASASEAAALIREIVASLTPEVSEREPIRAATPQPSPRPAIVVDATPEAVITAAGRELLEKPAAEPALAG